MAMVEIGKCIAVDLLKDGNEKFYFRTERSDKRYGVLYHFFCRMKPQEEITAFDFWGISEEYYNELVKEGKLRVVERFCDM